ncbi:MAG: [LysW]-aminoadipate/[LysW]-glutamate kinase [Thaumarchaeota archaeon]|nr:[LysW]-aminoadipate/[LysW]-glutamate kinase [Nitrososphaerota archaeon]MDE0266173.1 [LysW]-aminoadipate/[LysW]-glutamate kinase [Nitrososphaerota archaeon]MDE0527029.1 [LysW]-aminoadipate/[LysW]-glutamate kinase [Nitrososphaerota archaeon]
MITIKIGGSVVDEMHPSAVSDIKKVAECESVIIVHGGGKAVTSVCEQMGSEPRFVTSPSGIRSRYTDRETARIFTMVMSGMVNKEIVRLLQQNGINAVGLSGADARTIRARRKKRLIIVNEKGRKQAIDGGYTGKISEVNSGFIKGLLGQGIVPVISPVAISEEYEMLNVDGDRAAANVAGATGSDKVLFMTNVDGLMLDDRLVTGMSRQEARDAMPKIGPGMEKKVLASTEAIDMGVRTALIASGRRENPISRAIAEENCTVIRK